MGAALGMSGGSMFGVYKQKARWVAVLVAEAGFDGACTYAMSAVGFVVTAGNGPMR